MARQHLRFQQFFAAPRDQVFAFFGDHEKFGRIWPGRCRRIQESPDPGQINGLGSVREIRVNSFVSFEETITQYRPDDLIEYRVTRGGPVKNHVGTLRFQDVPGGTQLDYTIEFDPKLGVFGPLIAGTLCAGWHRGVHRAVENISRG